MATSPCQGPGSLPRDGGPGGRLHIHGIKEMPAGYDAEVAELFRDLRSASGLSEAELAAQLATRPEVVQALEQGALYALPPWPETYRVVATYGTLLNLDVRPLLRRIYAQVDAGVVGLAPKSMPDVPFMAPPESVGREFQGQARVSAPPVAEPAPKQPRQPAPPQPRGPQAAPNRQQAQGLQSRPQPQQNSQLLPQQQPQWPPQPRGAPPSPQRAATLPSQQPRPTPAPPREARAPSPPQQPQPRSPLPPRAASPEEKPARKNFPWKTIVKWGVVALVIVGIAAGLWMWLAKPNPLGPGSNPGQPGAKSSNKGAPTDPNDPRSRKADRLPGPS
jgi:helix-turn-helix protein